MHPANLHVVGVITVFRHVYGILGINDLESRPEVIQGHRFWYQSNAHLHIPISGL